MGKSKDAFGTDEEIARDAIGKLKTSRKAIEDCKDELEVIKKNVGLIYKGEGEGGGAAAYAATSTTLNTALEGVLQKFIKIEEILEEFVDTTVDNDHTNESNMSI